jgi:hypothetical protein
MAYIGRNTDKLSNIEVLDAITFDGSSSYTLQKNSVNFTPSSANNVLVSIDGVVQANNFTVSGSTIDFGVAVPSTSTCDWIYHIGVGLITTPADGTVTTAKLADSSVTTAKINDGAITSAKLASGVGGKILQVVTATDSTIRSTTSTSYVTASNTLSLNITPSSTLNKILITGQSTILTPTTDTGANLTIYRDGSDIITSTSGRGMFVSYVSAANNYNPCPFYFLDSPASTSSLSYQVYIKTDNASNQVQLNGNNQYGILIAYEIQG